MPEETSAGETGRREAMSDEALAEIRAHNGQYGIGDATDIIDELLAEVERLRAELDAISTHTTQQLQAWNEIGALTEAELRRRVVAAEGALEEMRGRGGEESVEWAADGPGGWMQWPGPHSEVFARGVAEAAAERGVTVMLMRRVVGEWKAADE